MKPLLFLSVLIILLCVSTNGILFQPKTTAIQTSSDNGSLKMIKLGLKVVEDLDRKDCLQVLIDAIEFYELYLGSKEGNIQKFIFNSFKWVLRKLQPIYYRLFPSTKPKEPTPIMQGFDAILNSSYVQEAANIYKQIEGPVFSSIKSILFD